MANSMFESVLGMVTPEMTRSIAGRLGESPSAVQHGLSAATAATLHNLARNCSDSGFTDQVMQTVSRAGSQNIAANVTSLASTGPSGAAGDLVSRFASLVFGSQQGHIANLVSQQSGLSGSTGNEILKTAAALVLGHLGKMHSSGSLIAGTLASTLRKEGSNLANYVPGSFLTSLDGTVTDSAGHASAYASNVIHTHGPRPTSSSSRSTRWIIPVAVVALAAILLGWLANRHSHNTTPSTVATEMPHNTTNATATVARPPAEPSPGARMTVSLPNGTQLNVPSDSVEARLVSYLQDPAAQVSEVTWFDFDRLLFDTGQATLQPQSNQQLDNVAVILKAYPAVKIRLGGYTDNTGDPTANQKLSEQRADSVMAALVQRGIDPSRLNARGYGEENPVADNSTEEGRQKNRRISIRVAEK